MKPKYDANTRRQLESQRRGTEIEKLQEEVADQNARLVVLEGVRRIQIEINGGTDNRLSKLEQGTPEKKSFWDFFK